MGLLQRLRQFLSAEFSSHYSQLFSRLQLMREDNTRPYRNCAVEPFAQLLLELLVVLIPIKYHWRWMASSNSIFMKMLPVLLRPTLSTSVCKGCHIYLLSS